MSRKTKITLTLAVTIVGLLVLGLVTAFASPGGVSTLGDFVWFDENGNGVKDEGPEWGDSGIDGVLVNLYLDDGDVVFEPGTDDALQKSMTTGDNGGTTDVEHGWYDFTEVGDHLGWWVEIADSNFNPGGPLEGYEYTGNNASNVYNGVEPRYVYIPDTLTDYNDADFAYTLKDIVAIGNLVWDDDNANSTFDGGEAGIDGVTVMLYRDVDGDGVPEPDGDDSSAIMTTTTSGGGIYQFLNVTPSAANDPTTNYFVAVVSSDVKNLGYLSSSPGGDQNPDGGDNIDDGIPAGSYVVSQPFAATKGGQTDTADTGDATGYADSSSYMTVDFGFTKNTVNAITLTSMKTDAPTVQWGMSLVVFGMVGLGAFAWRRRTL